MDSADATASGLPYPVLAVAGAAPVTLEQFVGQTTFTVDKSGAESSVRGVGARDGDAVRFQEKADGDGKDTRVWQIREGAEGSFTAATVSTY